MSKRQTETANADPWRQNETEISPAGAEAETESRGDRDLHPHIQMITHIHRYD